MKKFLARKGNEVGDGAVQFEAKNHDDAIRLLAEAGYTDYELFWEQPKGGVTKELVSDGKGGHILQIKEKQ